MTTRLEGLVIGACIGGTVVVCFGPIGALVVGGVGVVISLGGFGVAYGERRR